MRNQYGDYLSSHRGNARFARQSAQILTSLARITDLSGSRADALTTYEEALTLWIPLAESAGDDLTIQAALADTWHEIGTLRQALGRMADSRIAYHNAREIRERLVAAEPSNRRFLERPGTQPRLHRRLGARERPPRRRRKVVRRGPEDPQTASRRATRPTSSPSSSSHGATTTPAASPASRADSEESIRGEHRSPETPARAGRPRPGGGPAPARSRPAQRDPVPRLPKRPRQHLLRDGDRACRGSIRSSAKNDQDAALDLFKELASNVPGRQPLRREPRLDAGATRRVARIDLDLDQAGNDLDQADETFRALMKANPDVLQFHAYAARSLGRPGRDPPPHRQDQAGRDKGRRFLARPREEQLDLVRKSPTQLRFQDAARADQQGPGPLNRGHSAPAGGAERMPIGGGLDGPPPIFFSSGDTSPGAVYG